MNTITVAPDIEEGSSQIGVTEGGWHAAEGLILARYFMFTQVYFHKTRVAFDHHLNRALAEILPGSLFPGPKGNNIDEYLRWDDWRVLGHLASEGGGEHGRRLSERKHFREVYHTLETPTEEDLGMLEKCRMALGDILASEESAEKSWYKVDETDIPIFDERRKKVLPLSRYSSFVARIQPVRKVLLYVRPEYVEEALKRIQGIEGGK